MIESDVKVSAAGHGLYLSVDVGTHAVKAASFDECGAIHSMHTIDIVLQRMGGSCVEQDPKEILVALKQVVQRVVAETPEQLLSCGVATQRSTVLAWDRDTGEPLSKALSWQDTRGFEFIESIKDQKRLITDRSGLVLSPHYGASKLRWLQKQYSGRRVCLSPLISYLLFHLLDGNAVTCDESNASRTQLWNIHERLWDESLCELFQVDPALLPKVQPVLSSYGMLSRSLTQNRNIPITAVAGDQNAALVGALPKDSQALLVNVGSGAFVLGYQESKNVLLHGVLQSLAYSDESSVRRIVEGTVNGAGLALTWFAQSEELRGLGGESWLLDRLHEWLSQDVGEALFYNSVGGVGSPFWTIEKKPYFEPKHASLPARAVAIVESIVFLLAINVGVIRRTLSGLNSIYVSGGVSRFDGLCQRLANLTNCNVIRPAGHETTLLGVAKLASGFKVAYSEAEPRLFKPKLNTVLRQRFETFYSMMKPHRIVAHRGYASAFPENTLRAIEEAIQCGVDAIEFDIQFTKDDIPVVFHDYELKRLLGVQKNISELTFSDLRELSVHEPERFSNAFLPIRVPSLTEVVDLLRKHPEVQVFPEVKPEIFEHRTRSKALEILWACLEPLSQRCTIISYDLAVLRLVQVGSLCDVGWVLSDYSESEYKEVADNPVDVLISNQKRFPLKGVPLWQGPWEWFAYEITDKEMMVDCLERGVKWIESRDPLSLM